MSRNKKLGVIIGGALFLVGAILAFTYTPNTDPGEAPPVVRPAKTALVESGSRLVERTYSGQVEAGDQVDMAFRVSGPLVQLPVKAGQAVKAGQLLAKGDAPNAAASYGSAKMRWEAPMKDNAGKFRSEEHTSELQTLRHLLSRLLIEIKNT